ncbi:Pycsar system effector family protein [Puia sp.]|jgi:predicted metal-dependent HD superfamily phosphohydrolase|uniref:Pycsar system effector family protein n=1 Tax=Puia sp. TaxID=2045100 RepID=UPI002F3F31C2
MDHQTVLEQAEHYVRSLYDAQANDKLYYHDLRHTEGVVEAATQIAQHYQLSDGDFFTVSVAAWFHDIGYLTGPGAGHEERGARMVQSFLEGTGVEFGVIEAVKRCIIATQLPQRAVGLSEQIVCDADLYHLGTDEFSDRNKLMRKEAEAVQGRKISKDEWRRSTIRFLEAHQYYTDYCRLLLNEKQHENLMKLRAKDPDAGGNAIDTLLREHGLEESRQEQQQPMDKKKEKKKDPGRGIDTVFRITSNNNQKLSSQADSKAHILIQVNSIIISVLLSLLLRKIEDHTNLAIPATLLLAVNLVTIIFSILATRPHIPPGTFSQADLDEKKVNLLFFGNFYRMSLEQYASGMLIMMDDRDFLYGSLIRDVYFQGIALGKKYRWLRLSYNVFMYGLIASVLAFLIAALAFPTFPTK